MSDFTFNTKDIYVGDIIKAEEFVFSNVEKNNNEPYVEGRVIAGGKNNLFVKIANMYKSPISGKVYQALSFSNGLGGVGIQKNSIEPIAIKLKRAFKATKTESLDLSVEDMKLLQDKLSSVGNNEIDLAYQFGKFLQELDENERE